MKELETGFAEVEKRVKKLVEDNVVLKKRVAELERDLARARLESEELRTFHGKKLHIREKIEQVLHSLESIGEKGAERQDVHLDRMK